MHAELISVRAALDDESTRHLLNFEGMVLNSKTLEWTPCGPP